MLLRRILLATTLVASAGCAHKPAATPAQPAPAAAATATEPAATPAPAAETTPPPAPTPPAPECSAPTDCASKGDAAEGMQWACTDGKCTEEKKPARSKKKGKK